MRLLANTLHFFPLIFLATSGAVAGALGEIFSGLIMKKFRVSEQGASRFYSASVFVVCIGLAVLINFKCPQVQFAGNKNHETTL